VGAIIGANPTAVDSVDVSISSEYVSNTLSIAITDPEVRILILSKCADSNSYS